MGVLKRLEVKEGDQLWTSENMEKMNPARLGFDGIGQAQAERKRGEPSSPQAVRRSGNRNALQNDDDDGFWC